MGTRFSTTRWSQVIAARDGEGAEAEAALESLCERYWYPLYAFVRRQGFDASQAADLTQSYFAYLLAKKVLREVDPSAGRFRSFLLATMKHFLSHDRDKERAIARGGRATTISLDSEAAESRFQFEPADSLTPEAVFERRWALTVLEKTMELLREEHSGARDRERFELLKDFLTGDEPHIPYREVAGKLEMTEEAVRAAVIRLRQRFGTLLKAEIADTVADPGDVDDEIRHLLGVIGPWEPPNS